MTADETLNELLVKLFKDIMEIEGKSLITDEFKDLTYNDFHVIEAIGISEPKSMSTVAKLMNVTTGTLTKAMDGLTDKGYVVRERSKQDKRVVWVCLTEKGKAAYLHHEEFHHRMIDQYTGWKQPALHSSADCPSLRWQTGSAPVRYRSRAPEQR